MLVENFVQLYDIFCIILRPAWDPLPSSMDIFSKGVYQVVCNVSAVYPCTPMREPTAHSPHSTAIIKQHNIENIDINLAAKKM